MGIEGLRTATAAAAASLDFSFSLFESGGRLESVDGIPFSMVGGGKSLRLATQRRKNSKKFVKSQATELQNQGTSGGTPGFTSCWTWECTIFKMITLPSYLRKTKEPA